MSTGPQSKGEKGEKGKGESIGRKRKSVQFGHFTPFNFPKKVNINGESESNGESTMYFKDELGNIQNESHY